MTDNKRDILIKKMVSNARAILSNQIALPLGIQKMINIIEWIRQIDPVDSIYTDVFQDCYSKISKYPLGTDRLNYSQAFFIKEDNELTNIILIYKDQVIDCCYKIIKDFNK